MNNKEPIVIDFPLRGEWVAPNTPGDKVPSHGTDSFGLRFAYDFYRTERNSQTKFYKSSIFKYLTIGIPINECYCYKENIYSPVDGVVVVVKDGAKEPKRLHLVLDLFKVLLNSIFVPVSKINLHKYTGNYVIIKFDEVYAFFAHICPNSICVKEGQIIKKGDLIGFVGHTGNSTAPHLHFHLMDSLDLLTAKGIPCIFNKYDLLIQGEWISFENSIPKSNQRIRYV